MSSQEVTRLEAELKRLAEEKQQILDASTAGRLERNRQSTIETMNALSEARREMNQQINAATLDPEHEQLRQSNINIASQIRGLEDRAMLGSGAFPEKYVRDDAVAHFRKQFADAEAKQSTLLDQINRIERNPNASAGGRLRQELAECEMITGQWPKVEKLARIGEQIFILKQDVRTNQERMEQLQTERRERALAVV